MSPECREQGTWQHPRIEDSWRELGPRAGVQFSDSWSCGRHRPLPKKLLEALRTKGTLAVLPLAFVGASFGETCQVSGWQGILGNAAPEIESSEGRGGGRGEDRQEGKSDGLVRQNPGLAWN